MYPLKNQKNPFAGWSSDLYKWRPYITVQIFLTSDNGARSLPQGKGQVLYIERLLDAFKHL